MHEVATSVDFWDKVRRRFAGAGVELTRDIRTGDQDAEQDRWRLLIPEPEHLAKIREIEASPEWPAIQRAWAAREQS
jgi:hypothetical protein